ncbi:MAG: HAD family phosphatase [Calditrichaceae bacterium]|nr:HAD family phosphatase [Calditrichaceae bacterium]MBN2710096.1 HAD family phosphatase [Calditrichaceae bacterium]RQV94265.1 MAG: HAD family phosphatase [Calditrichota bacterium]
MRKKAILFDFDGVVVKSMEQHFNAWQQAFAEEKINLRPEEFFILEGQGIRSIAGYLGQKKGMSKEQITKVMDRKVNYYNKFMTIEFYDHFPEMLNKLKKNNIPMGIVTGGTKSRVIKVVKEYFDNTFMCVITVDDVERGKPFPDSFLKGAQELGFNPKECLVIENAPLGIEGGLAAGMKVIAITTTLPEKVLSKAHIVVKDFRELEREIFKSLDISHN